MYIIRTAKKNLNLNNTIEYYNNTIDLYSMIILKRVCYNIQQIQNKIFGNTIYNNVKGILHSKYTYRYIHMTINVLYIIYVLLMILV